MVLLDQNFDAFEIYEAERAAVLAVLTAPGSKARNERGAMAVSKFRSIGKLRWRRPHVDNALRPPLATTQDPRLKSRRS